MQSAAALKVPLHLACVAGPDRGLIIAIEGVCALGRTAWPQLTDPCTPRVVGTISEQRHTRQARATLRRPQRADRTLSVGAQVRIGADVWELRSRPKNRHWQFPSQKRPWALWGRCVPVVILIFLLWRIWKPSASLMVGIAASAAVVGLAGALSWTLGRRRRFDPGFLTLAAPAQCETPIRSVWISRVGGRTLQFAPGSTVGVVGQAARSHALWLGGQIALATGMPLSEDCPPTGTPQLWCRAPNTGGIPPPGTITVAWGQSVTAIPDEAERIIDSRPVACPNWEPSPAGNPVTEPNSNLFDASVDAIQSRWQLRSRSLRVPVGRDAEQLACIDLDAQGPHALIAGATGSGKSVALRTWLISLASHLDPRDLQLVLIDYKGGAGLGALQSLPHTIEFATDLQKSGSAQLLRQMGTVMDTRKLALQSAGLADIKQWEASSRDAPPRLIVVIDEFQMLAEEHPEFVATLGRLSSQGRSLGIHLLLATQHPGPVVTPTLRATLDLRIALRCTEAADSVAVVGTDAATQLPRTPGMAIVDQKPIRFAELPAPLMPSGATGPTSWPRRLPQSTLVKPGVVIRHNQIVPVELGKESLLLAGPVGTGAELADYAWSLATYSRGPHTPAPLIVRPEMGAGDIAWTLQNATANDVLVVVEVAGVLRELDAAGIGLESLRLWSRLIAAKPTAGPRLLVTDTEGHPKSPRLPSRLLRLPSEGAFTEPSLLRVVPNLRPFGIGLKDGVPSREEAIDPLPGRFLAVTSHSLDIVQLATPLPAPEEIPPLRAAVLSAAAAVIGNSDVAQALSAQDVPAALWLPTLKENSDGVFIPAPSLEIVRYLSSCSTPDSLWIRARFPYPATEGLFIGNGTVTWTQTPLV